jgi:hypothetical protein
MKRGTKITVTQEDIDRGARNSLTDCPVARAVNRIFSGAVVNTQDIEVSNGRMERTFQWAPVRVQQFVRRFDKAKPVKPFSFFLRPV